MIFKHGLTGQSATIHSMAMTESSPTGPSPRLSWLRWPLPALLAWGGAWALLRGTLALGLVPALAVAAACLLGVGLSLLGDSWWRRLIIGLGFPLSLLLSGVIAVPAWGWLLPLAVLALIYPLNAWRDAPLFPTPHDALGDLGRLAPLPGSANVLDAGCGLGHGLSALRQAYPQVRLHGTEGSWPLRFLCAWRCPWARVRQGDLWRDAWHDYDLVYLFQRPESMRRAADKALAELRPGAWLVSLEFEAQALLAQARAETPDGRPVWLYQAPLKLRPATITA